MMKKPICFLALVFVLFGCDESLRFEEPQPSGFPKLGKIPKAIRGTYMDKDSTYLVIGRKSIIQKYSGAFTEPLENLAKDIADDENVVISDSSEYGFKAYAKEEDIEFRASYNRETGIGTFEYEEDRFSIDNQHVVKVKDGAYYFSAYRKEDTAWTLRKLVLKGDSLLVFKTHSPKEIEDLEALTEVKDHFKKNGESKGWKINPDPEVLDMIFDRYGKKVSGYKRMNK